MYHLLSWHYRCGYKIKNSAMKKEQLDQSKSGTGSAEQTGRDRAEQRQEQQDVDQQQRQDVGNQIGVSSNEITSAKELGQMSGRDDASGGSGDDMENENSGGRTNI
jgi:hypothetical protein